MSTKNKSELPNVNRMDTSRKYRLGTRLMNETGQVFQYAKLDFGVIGKVDGKTYRKIQHRWIRTY